MGDGKPVEQDHPGHVARPRGTQIHYKAEGPGRRVRRVRQAKDAVNAELGMVVMICWFPTMGCFRANSDLRVNTGAKAFLASKFCYAG